MSGVDDGMDDGAARPPARGADDQAEMLKLAARLAHLGHWIWSRDTGRLSFCSDELARIHDLTPAVFIARFPHPAMLEAVIVPSDRARYRAAVEAAIAGPSAYEIEYGIETAAGVGKHLRETGGPVRDARGGLTRFIAAVQDVTAARRREHALARAQDELRRRTGELEESNLQKDKLFSIVAHDLRSPFNTVMGFADLLAMHADGLSRDKIASYARIVRESAADVHGLLDNLLAWASFQIRGRARVLLPLDLGAVAAVSIQPLMHMAEEKGVAVVNTIAPTRIRGDADLIRIVFRNLVSNAIKFSRPGGRVVLSAARGADGAGPTASGPMASIPTAPIPMVRVTVRDDGVGMSPEAAAGLFALKRAASTPGTQGEQGTGLGLYLCRDIVAQHGGVMSVESADGAGTAVHFTLPVAA